MRLSASTKRTEQCISAWMQANWNMTTNQQETKELCEWQWISVVIINTSKYIHAHIHIFIHDNMSMWICDIIYSSNREYHKIKQNIYMYIYTYIYISIYAHNYTTYQQYNTHATWVHTALAHTKHVHTEGICVYKCESIHVMHIAREIGPTNSYSVWASAGMIGQGTQYESPTPYTSQRGW